MKSILPWNGILKRGDVKAKECQSKWASKQKDVKSKLISKIKWLSNQAGVTVNSRPPFVLPRAKILLQKLFLLVYERRVANRSRAAKRHAETKIDFCFACGDGA